MSRPVSLLSLLALISPTDEIALTPFHKDDANSIYDSTGVRSTRSLGYTYPELLDWEVSASQLTANVKTAINSLYSPGNKISKRQSKPPYSNSTASYDITGYEYGINVAVNGYA